MPLNLKDHNLSLVLTTESNYINAKKLAKGLFDKKLAACISFLHINSTYWWEDELKEDSEVQMHIKVKSDDIDKLYDAIKKLHSYKVPEFLSFNVKASEEYFRWYSDIVDGL